MPQYKQLTLNDLFDMTGPKPRAKAANARVLTVKRRKNIARYVYVVRAFESYSKPTGHVVSFAFPNISLTPKQLLAQPQLTPMNRRVRVHCTCPAWLYWGSAFLATREGYELGPGAEKRPALIRDPQEQNAVCKHVVCVIERVRKQTFKDLFKDFQITAADAGVRYAPEVAPVVREYLVAEGAYDSEIDDVLAGMDESNFEDVLDAHHMLVETDGD